MIDGSDDAPVGNLLLDRTGTFWPIAAGASNCAGKGGPAIVQPGHDPARLGQHPRLPDRGRQQRRRRGWPQVQIDAYFAGSNALNAHVGNLPTDVITHHGPWKWAPTRKIDPATAAERRGAVAPTAAAPAPAPGKRSPTSAPSAARRRTVVPVRRTAGEAAREYVWAPVLGWVGVALLALGWLLL
jgi:hypothetical protein